MTSTGSTDSVWDSRRVLAVAAVCVMVLGLLGIGITALTVLQQREFVSCQKQYNEDVVKALSEHSVAGDLDRQAARDIATSTTEMVDSLFQPGATVDQRTEAVRKWRNAQAGVSRKLKEAQDKRDASPLPSPRQC